MIRPENSGPAAGGPVVLASSSPGRRAVLASAGVPFEVDPPRVDEDEVKRALRADQESAEGVADVLAELKAARMSARHAGRMVLGADQVLECEGRQYDKPVSRDEAVAQLKELRGRRHRLVSCAVVVRDGQRIWQALDVAELGMRDFTDDFIDRYLDAAGSAVLDGPGAYRVEALGVQLFREIKGSHFTILGLPLLPLLDFLRENGVLRK